jgi:hypothetical protein
MVPLLCRWSQGLLFHQALVDLARSAILLPLGQLITVPRGYYPAAILLPLGQLITAPRGNYTAAILLPLGQLISAPRGNYPAAILLPLGQLITAHVAIIHLPSPSL